MDRRFHQLNQLLFSRFGAACPRSWIESWLCAAVLDIVMDWDTRLSMKLCRQLGLHSQMRLGLLDAVQSGDGAARGALAGDRIHRAAHCGTDALFQADRRHSASQQSRLIQFRGTSGDAHGLHGTGIGRTTCLHLGRVRPPTSNSPGAYADVRRACMRFARCCWGRVPRNRLNAALSAKALP